MPVVVEIALKAAEQILEAAGRLVQQPHSKVAQQLLVRGSHGVLEGTMKVGPSSTIVLRVRLLSMWLPRCY